MDVKVAVVQKGMTMKRTLGPGIVLLGLLAVLGFPSPAAAHLGGEHFQVVSRPMSEHYEDNGRKGESRGDTFSFTEKLMKDGKRIGHDTGSCTVMRATRTSFTMQCVVTLIFKNKGQLTVQGALVFKRGVRSAPELAITGGTGDYAGASGVMFLNDKRGEPSRFRIHLEG